MRGLSAVVLALAVVLGAGCGSFNVGVTNSPPPLNSCPPAGCPK